MKKLIVSTIGLLLFLAVAFAVYRFSFRKSIPDAPAPQQVAAILEQNGCSECHNTSKEAPFYAQLPVAKSILAQHIEHGSKFFDYKDEDFNNPSEVLLAMLEYTVQHDNMPIAQYKAVHWGNGFNKEEKSVLTKWIQQERAKRYASGLASAEFAGEVIQPIPAVQSDPAKVALGEKMYNDMRISLDGTVSCATCHVLKNGGASDAAHRTSEGINGQFGGINAPTVFNAVFNVEQFWNGRAHTLADQAAGPPENPLEMGDQTWDQIVERLRKDTGLVAQFKAIYPEGLTKASVTDAIAEYEKTLTTPNDKLDQYLRGNKQALTAEELAGYQAFKDNSCATCHVGKSLGGQSFAHLGIFEDYFTAREKDFPDVKYNDDDKGLNGFTGKPEDLHKYKVPNLRNISKTAPYFHDGTLKTIDEAVKAMFRFELGKEATDEQVTSITTFLKALDGESPHFEK